MSLLVYLSLALPVFAANADCGEKPPIKNFGVEKFIDAIKAGAIPSLDASLCLIPEAVRKNAVLVNNSISLQNGTLENPRAIMFDIGKAEAPLKFAISYNGHPSQHQFNSLEVMKFDISKKPHEQIEFIDIHFDQEGGNPKITRNPESCFSCHGFRTNIPRPLWDASGFQPSAYGGRQSSSLMKNIGLEEVNRAQTFIDSYRNHPRYKTLGQLDIEIVRDAKASNIFVPEADLNKPYYLIKSDILSARNNLFGQRLAIINRRRVAEIIRTSKDYDKYKFAIAAAFSKCSEIADLIPQSLKDAHTNLNGVDPLLLGPLSDSNVLAVQQNKENIFLATHSTKINLDGFRKILSFRNAQVSNEIIPYYIDTEASVVQWGGGDTERTANLRWLFEPRGIDMAAWNMDATGFSQGFYRFINYGGLNDSREDLTLYFQELLKGDGELNLILKGFGGRSESTFKEFIDDMKSLNKDQLCDTLKAKSLSTFR
jgi:hypothetical protein